MDKFRALAFSIGITSLSFSPQAWCQALPKDNVELKHHHCHHHHCCSRKGITGATGPTGTAGPTGAPGATGSMGATGQTGAAGTIGVFSPSFGSYYSSTGQTAVLPEQAVFFENADFPTMGNAFSFTPAIGATIFSINQTGYYDISYGVFGDVASASFEGGLGLQYNAATLTGSEFVPYDCDNDHYSMAAFGGIFHLGVSGSLSLINIGAVPLSIFPATEAFPDSNVHNSAYINIKFLSPD